MSYFKKGIEKKVRQARSKWEKKLVTALKSRGGIPW
jgi:hypothetical protein